MMVLLSQGHSLFLTDDIIKRCKEAGILTVLDFLSVDTETLSQKISTPYKDISSIRSILLGTYSSFVQTGESLYQEQLQSLSILSTGCFKLDEFLDGGIYTSEITEIHGHAGSGKTQLCLNLATSVITGSSSTVLYLDTTGNFTGQRFKQLLLKRLNDFHKIEASLNMLRVINVYDVYNLFDTLHSIKEHLVAQEEHFFSRLKLIVVDSMTPLIAPCLGNNQFDGHGLLVAAVQQLKLLCKDHSLSVVVCNNMVHSETSIKPALGRYWTYVPSVALCLEKHNLMTQASLRTLILVKSCRHRAFSKIHVTITEDGISFVDSV